MEEEAMSTETVIPARKDYVRTMLISLQVHFKMAVSKIPYDTKEHIHQVDSLDTAFHRDMRALEIALGVG